MIVGGGPAGLRAAEIAAQAGTKVEIIEGSRTPGRKFLLAGKSGLNLTNARTADFATHYTNAADEDFWQRAMATFSPDALRDWSADLGYETFESAGGKVFPECMRGAPLLRAWLQRLNDFGVNFRLGKRVVDWHPETNTLELEGGESVAYSAVIFALGGASWPRTGSDGSWVSWFQKAGIEVNPLQPANCGWEVEWPAAFLEQSEGKPLKNVAISTQSSKNLEDGPKNSVLGELMITRYGLEGGPIYRLGPALRAAANDGPVVELMLDLKPSLALQAVEKKLAPVRKNYIREARRRLRLCDVGAALLKTLPNLGPWDSAETLAKAIKGCPIPLTRPRPIDEAISTAGGVCWSELVSEELKLKKMPNAYVAGEMLDWEAPTGGYLLQGCFATGQIAAQAALRVCGK